MKTKLIILTAAAAVLLYSCSNDRDEDVRKEAIEKVKASNQEKIKLNKPSLQSRDAESESIKDTIIIRNSNTVGTGITPAPEDPDETIDPTKPDKPW